MVKVDRYALRRLVDQAGLNDAELARRMGVEPAVISRTVLGKRQIVLDEIYAIAQVLGVEPTAIFALTYLDGAPKVGRPKGAARRRDHGAQRQPDGGALALVAA